MTEEETYQQKISMLEQQINQLKQQPTTSQSVDETMLDSITSFFLTKLNKNETIYEKLPIRKIDGLKVDVFIKTFKNFNNMMKIYLLIEDSMPEFFCLHDDGVGYHEYLRKDFDVNELTSDEIKRVIQQILTILNNIEFYKLNGSFVEKGKQPPDNTALVWKKLIMADNVEWKVNECPVCMEDTFSTTICDHSLCRCCFQKLKKSQCPTCRHPLSFDDDDSDEEDDG